VWDRRGKESLDLCSMTQFQSLKRSRQVEKTSQIPIPCTIRQRVSRNLGVSWCNHERSDMFVCFIHPKKLFKRPLFVCCISYLNLNLMENEKRYVRLYVVEDHNWVKKYLQFSLNKNWRTTGFDALHHPQVVDRSQNPVYVLTSYFGRKGYGSSPYPQPSRTLSLTCLYVYILNAGEWGSSEVKAGHRN
jgi:hypothetical protein